MIFTGFKKRLVYVPFLLIIVGFLFGPVFTIMSNADQAQAMEIPEWVQKMKMKGDVRFRYQGQEMDPDGDVRKRQWNNSAH